LGPGNICACQDVTLSAAPRLKSCLSLNSLQFDGSNVSPSLPVHLVQELTATLLCKLGPGQSEVAEELCLRLQHKEKMLQDLLSDRNRQTMEHDAEIRELLQAVSTKEQQSRVSCGEAGVDGSALH